MKSSIEYAWMLAGLLMLSFTSNGQDGPATGPHGCTMHLNDRSKVPVTRFWRIDEYTVEYEHEGSLHDVPLTSVERIQCANGDYVIEDLQLLLVNDPFRADTAGAGAYGSPSDRYRLGEQDGKKYYHGGGAFVGGMLTAPTLIGPWIIAAVRPPLDNPKNPNIALLKDPDYRKGYKKTAHGKKAGHAMLGMITGLALLMVAAAE